MQGSRCLHKCTLFLSTLSLRRATSQCRTLASGIYGFLSTLSLRRATPRYRNRTWAQSISIHALLAESDHRRIRCLPHWADFYPRSPCGERPCNHTNMHNGIRISIHALLAESDVCVLDCIQANKIYFYPRSPCGERRSLVIKLPLRSDISIHALLAESDYILPLFWHLLFQFLSTLSLRRATCRLLCTTRWAWYFYPRSPCGERLSKSSWLHTASFISIHALLAESDPAVIKNSTAFSVFLSTLSLRRATRTKTAPAPPAPYFYPRSPCGERLQIHSCSRPSQQFLSTLSLRRATTIATASKNRYLHFYPRSPCGERLNSFRCCLCNKNFYPRSPCGERQIFGLFY